MVAPVPGVGDDDASIDLDADEHERQRDGDQDQKISDLEDRSLRMRGRAGGRNELGGLSEERVVAGLGDDAGHGALLDDAAGIGGVTDFLGDRQRLAGECRLIDTQVFTVDQQEIGRHDLAAGDIHHIAGDKLGGVERLPGAVPQHARLGGKSLLERVKRVGGLVLLPEADDRVVDQQPRHHEEVRPVLPKQRDQCRRFDHPRQRAPEIRRELAPSIFLRGLRWRCVRTAPAATSPRMWSAPSACVSSFRSVVGHASQPSSCGDGCAAGGRYGEVFRHDCPVAPGSPMRSSVLCRAKDFRSGIRRPQSDRARPG